jgi:O-antigen/teichoic acid export membrane protein
MLEPSNLPSLLASVRARILGLCTSTTKKRLATGAFWGGLTFAISRSVAIGVSFLLARRLGQSGFGEYGIINTTAGMIGGMAGLGIGATVVKHIAEFKCSNPDKASRILALSSAIAWISAFVYALAFVALAPWIAEKALAAPHLAPLLRISAFTVAFGVINSVQTCSLTGCEAFQTNTQAGVICSLLQAGLVLFGAWTRGIEGAIWGLAISMFLTVFVTRWAVIKEWRRFQLRLLWQDALREWRVLLDFSLPAFLSGISVGPVLWGCSAMLANQPEGYAELGIYNAAIQWQQAIQFLPALLGTALLPILAEKCGRGDWQGSLAVMWRMVKIVSGIAFPLAVVLSLLSPWIMRGYGESFVAGSWTLVLVVNTAALLAVMTPVGNLIAASGRMWMGFWMNMGWGGAMLVASWWLVRWGAEGLAAAQLVAYLCHAVWTFGFVYVVRKRAGRAPSAASGCA